MIHLVLGGARSGKSNFAESWCLQNAEKNTNKALFYVATATNFDNEMDERIKHHQQSRDAQWQLIECPLTLSDELSNASTDIYLVDCLTLWLNNLLFSSDVAQTKSTTEKEQEISEKIEQLTHTLITASQNGVSITLVANEVGLGIIPMGKETRLFVDYAGWLNQAIARIANRVTLVTAGIPMTLKGN